jgi:hypothetical protein
MAERKSGRHLFTSVFVCPLTFEEAPILQGFLALLAFPCSWSSAAIRITDMGN